MARAYRVERGTSRVRLPGRNDTRPMVMPPPRPGRSHRVERDPARVVPTAATAVPRPLAVATEVGALGSAATTITMIPADLTQGPRADITEFTIVSIDAGIYP